MDSALPTGHGFICFAYCTHINTSPCNRARAPRARRGGGRVPRAVPRGEAARLRAATGQGAHAARARTRPGRARGPGSPTPCATAPHTPLYFSFEKQKGSSTHHLPYKQNLQHKHSTVYYLSR